MVETLALNIPSGDNLTPTMATASPSSSSAAETYVTKGQVEMPIETKSLPGHVGNLTRDETYKLKEAYLVLYKNTKMAPADAEVAGHAPTVEQKRSRLGFGGKHTVVEDSLDRATEVFGFALKTTTPAQVKFAIRVMKRGDIPDQVMLRFLRARKWDVVKSVQMIADTLHWRITEGHVETLLARGERYYVDKKPDPQFVNLYKKGLSCIRGHDKQGRPIVLVRARLHDPKGQSEEALERFTLLTIETARMCLHGSTETAAVIFDLGEFTLANMDYGAVKFILRCFEAHYPESLGYVFIHRAPWVFGGVWNIIKPMIDPVVASKISFTRNDKDLLKFIDSDQLPEELGGTGGLKYEYKAPVAEDDEAMDDLDTRDQLTAEREALFDEFDKLTLQWIQTEGPEADKLEVERQKLSHTIARQYWKCDPYVRSRLQADRDGTITAFQTEFKDEF